MVINNNMLAINTTNALFNTRGTQQKSMEKLSSGLRINRAGDDAAGLAISEKMRGQIKGLNQASRNAQDGISLVQTAEGALTETQSILQRMRELVVQGSNDTYLAADRGYIAEEIGQLKLEIDRIATTTEFNTKKLLNGDLNAASSVKLQVGANADQMISFKIGSMGASALKVNNVASVMKNTSATAGSISSLITTVNSAIDSVSKQRSTLGSVQNRLEHTITNLNTGSENLQASESRIRDTDMASEMVNLTRSNILQQAAQSMLAQANQAPQGVLSLLR